MLDTSRPERKPVVGLVHYIPITLSTSRAFPSARSEYNVEEGSYLYHREKSRRLQWGQPVGEKVFLGVGNKKTTRMCKVSGGVRPHAKYQRVQDA